MTSPITKDEEIAQLKQQLAKVTDERDALQGLVNIDGRSELGLRHNPRAQE